MTFCVYCKNCQILTVDPINKVKKNHLNLAILKTIAIY
jgi:hypothetical protein